jgi:hypothetical protein
MRRLGRALGANRRVVAVTAGAGLLALAVPDLRQAAAGALAALLLLTVRVRLRRRPAEEAAERSTEAELATLDSKGWVAARSGSFEHLVVGPSGAYLLETKRFTGEAMLRDGVLGVRRDDDTSRLDETLAGRLRGNARDARRLLGAANINWVAPVVVLWCEFPAQVAEHGSVTYVHGSRLATWLEAQPASLSAQSVENARSCLRRLEAVALREAA